MIRNSLPLLLLLAAACGNGPADPEGAGGAGGGGGAGGEGGGGGAIACAPELLVRTPDGAWLPADGADAGFYAGWQGFVYLLVRVRVADPRAHEAIVTLTTETDGTGEKPASQSRVALTPEGQGAVSPDLMVFFNDAPWDALVGHQSLLRASMTGDCEGAMQGTVTLVGAPEPPGGGGGGEG